MGPDTPDGHAALTERYTNRLQNDPADIWIKVVNVTTDEIVAASNWKVYVTCPPTHSTEDSPSWLSGEAFERAKNVYSQGDETRRKGVPGPHVRKYKKAKSPIFSHSYIKTTNATDQARTQNRPAHLLHLRRLPPARRRRHDAAVGR